MAQKIWQFIGQLFAFTIWTVTGIAMACRHLRLGRVGRAARESPGSLIPKHAADEAQRMVAVRVDAMADEPNWISATVAAIGHCSCFKPVFYPYYYYPSNY